MSELNEIELGQICRSASDSLRSTEFGLSNFPGLLKKVIRYRAWERRQLVTADGMPKGKVIELSSLRELITEKPIRGWGEDPKKVEAVLRDDPEALAMFREAMTLPNHRPVKAESSNNVTTLVPMLRGTSRAYSIARVQRECDAETVAAVMAGDISPNAALVKSGIRDNRQVYIPRDPAKAALKLRQMFDIGFVNELARLLSSK